MAAASEEGRVVTNGMSEFARDKENINGAPAGERHPGGFRPATTRSAGVAFQRQLEDAAYRAGGGNYLAPAQRVEDFLARRPSTGPGRRAFPATAPASRWTNLHRTACRTLWRRPLREALPILGRKLKGYDQSDAVLTAVESRSSSPGASAAE